MANWDLRIGKTKILTEPMRGARPIPFQSRREALTCSNAHNKLSRSSSVAAIHVPSAALKGSKTYTQIS